MERFHHQLKVALKATPEPTHRVKALPLVLLGIRAGLKQDIGCSTAELVYGTTLRLPGEFFSTNNEEHPDPTSYVTNLKHIMSHLQPPKARQVHRSAHVSDILSKCTHVFVRYDAVKKPLQQPYDGPFKVIKRTNKHFTVDCNGRQSVIAIDRLKPGRCRSHTRVFPFRIAPYTAPNRQSHSIWPASKMATETKRFVLQYCFTGGGVM